MKKKTCGLVQLKTDTQLQPRETITSHIVIDLCAVPTSYMHPKSQNNCALDWFASLDLKQLHHVRLVLSFS